MLKKINKCEKNKISHLKKKSLDPGQGGGGYCLAPIHTPIHSRGGTQPAGKAGSHFITRHMKTNYLSPILSPKGLLSARLAQSFCQTSQYLLPSHPNATRSREASARAELMPPTIQIDPESRARDRTFPSSPVQVPYTPTHKNPNEPTTRYGTHGSARVPIMRLPTPQTPQTCTSKRRPHKRLHRTPNWEGVGNEACLGTSLPDEGSAET